MLARLVAISFVALTLAPPGFASSTASPQPHHGKREIEPASPASHRNYYPRPERNYVGWSYIHHSPGRWVYFGPSYTYVPGKGIVDEACNLPTSACPNSQRANY